MLKLIQALSDWIKQQQYISRTRVGRFIIDVLAELLRVTWPTNEEIKTSTAVVMATLVIVALYLWVVGFALFRGIGFLEDLIQKLNLSI
jgi:preprotein translocase subunit SecE